MAFVFGAFSYDRPSLAPLFSLLSLHKPGVVTMLPVCALIVARWLYKEQDQKQRRVEVVQQRAVVDKAVLRVDAKAQWPWVGGPRSTTRQEP